MVKLLRKDQGISVNIDNEHILQPTVFNPHAQRLYWEWKQPKCLSLKGWINKVWYSNRLGLPHSSQGMNSIYINILDLKSKCFVEKQVSRFLAK